MPEGAEVEVAKQILEQNHLVYKKIINVEVYEPKLIDNPNDVATFTERMLGATFYDIKRYGKFFIFTMIKDTNEYPYFFVAHYGMTGAFFLFRDESDIPSKYKNHLRAKLELDNGKTLFYCDIRKFGSLRCVTPEEYGELPLTKYGPDILSYDINTEFIRRVRASKDDGNGNKIMIYGNRPIKQVLMDQQAIAGIGNIYANEGLFMMGIHPETPCEKLTDVQLREIIGTTRSLMELSVEMGGCSFSDYMNPEGRMGEFQDILRVYHRDGEDCQAECGAQIQKITVDNRATFFCPTCQPVI